MMVMGSVINDSHRITLMLNHLVTITGYVSRILEEVLQVDAGELSLRKDRWDSLADPGYLSSQYYHPTATEAKATYHQRFRDKK